MYLYLVRHGAAVPKEADPERPLAKRGRDDVEKVARAIQPLRLSVEVVWHSGKTRARETAEILGPSVSSTRGIARREGLTPLDPVDPVRGELTTSTRDLMIVGHLPFLAALSSALLAASGSALIKFPPGGIVCLERGEDESWEVAWMLIPDLLPEG